MQKLFIVALTAAVLTGCGVAPTQRATVAPAGTTAAKFDPAVAAAKAEIKRFLQAENDTKVESLSVSPTPLGTIFSFRATVAEGDTRFEVTGVYDSLAGEVRVSKKQAAK